MRVGFIGLIFKLISIIYGLSVLNIYWGFHTCNFFSDGGTEHCGENREETENCIARGLRYHRNNLG